MRLLLHHRGPLHQDSRRFAGGSFEQGPGVLDEIPQILHSVCFDTAVQFHGRNSLQPLNKAPAIY